MTLITPARLGLMSAACLLAAAVLAFSEEAHAACLVDVPVARDGKPATAVFVVGRDGIVAVR